RSWLFWAPQAPPSNTKPPVKKNRKPLSGWRSLWRGIPGRDRRPSNGVVDAVRVTAAKTSVELTFREKETSHVVAHQDPDRAERHADPRQVRHPGPDRRAPGPGRKRRDGRAGHARLGARRPRELRPPEPGRPGRGRVLLQDPPLDR